LKVVAVLLGLQQGYTKFCSVSGVKETVEQKLLITRRRAGLLHNHLNREKRMYVPAAGTIQQHFAAFPAHKTGTIGELC
jgi:hypothetical protein